MTLILGNSGAPRWYDGDRARFSAYLDLLERCRATAAEIVLHHGDADDYTARIHLLEPDWDQVIQGYRDRDLRLFVHGPLTPEFSPLQWSDDPRATMERYDPILRQVAEIAQDQGGTTLVVHAVSDQATTLESNERDTARFLSVLAETIERWTSNVRVAIELRAFRPERPTAAGTSRESILRILEGAGHPAIGICWDVAHDLESVRARGERWSEPGRSFLERVVHLHLHDLGTEGESHYPPLTGQVPIANALDRLPALPCIMEVRWRMATRMGEPWEVLAESYVAVRRLHPRSSENQDSSRS